MSTKGEVPSRAKLLCRGENVLMVRLCSRGGPVRRLCPTSCIHPRRFIPCTPTRGRIHEDGTFMIGSVTKLTLYADSRTATHKDDGRKKRMPFKERCERSRGTRVCSTQKNPRAFAPLDSRRIELHSSKARKRWLKREAPVRQKELTISRLKKIECILSRVYYFVLLSNILEIATINRSHRCIFLHDKRILEPYFRDTLRRYLYNNIST